MAFYGRAFGLQKGQLADKGVYGEMLGGDVKLQFVQEDFARQYVPDFVPNRLERPAPGAAYHRANQYGMHVRRSARKATVGTDDRFRAR